MNPNTLRYKNIGSELTDRQFLAVLGGFVVIGLLVSTFMATLTYNWNPNIFVMLFIGLAIPFYGIHLSITSDDWVKSAIGYALVVIPFGALIGPVVALYEVPSVLQIMAATLVVSTLLWVVGMLVPPITKNWSAYIVGALLVLIAGDLSRIFMPMFGVQPVALEIWDWVGILLFSGLIVYDVNKAMQREKTMDSAVDSAVAIYLDIINLFLRALSAKGKRKSR